MYLFGQRSNNFQIDLHSQFGILLGFTRINKTVSKHGSKVLVVFGDYLLCGRDSVWGLKCALGNKMVVFIKVFIIAKLFSLWSFHIHQGIFYCDITCIFTCFLLFFVFFCGRFQTFYFAFAISKFSNFSGSCFIMFCFLTTT